MNLPLSYCGQTFGFALVDDHREDLQAFGPLSVVLPKSLRRVAGTRPDVILAFLVEDRATRMKCTPYISTLGTSFRLPHLVLRPTLASLVLSLRGPGGVKDGGPATPPCPPDVNPTEILEQIESIRRTINRHVHVNGDRTDCRTANLRELLISEST